jgi:hypothetical protein
MYGVPSGKPLYVPGPQLPCRSQGQKRRSPCPNDLVLSVSRCVLHILLLAACPGFPQWSSLNFTISGLKIPQIFSYHFVKVLAQNREVIYTKKIRQKEGTL